MSSHSRKGGFKKQEQYSTVSDTIEVGCNYSGDTKKGIEIWSSNKGDFTAVMLYAGPARIHRNFPSGEDG